MAGHRCCARPTFLATIATAVVISIITYASFLQWISDKAFKLVTDNAEYFEEDDSVFPIHLTEHVHAAVEKLPSATAVGDRCVALPCMSSCPPSTANLSSDIGAERANFSDTTKPWVVLWMVGDSTMRIQHQTLCETNGDKFQKTSYKEGLARVCNFTTRARHVTAIFMGFHKLSFATPEFLPVYYAAVPVLPSVIYFNGGLHWLHLLPERKWDYEEWRHAERLILQFLSAAAAYGAVLVFMPNHAICEDKINDHWADRIAFLHREPLKAMEVCTEWLQIEKRRSALVAREECLEGTFTLAGIQAFNARLRLAWRSWLDEATRIHATAACVDAFAITDGQCAFTEDGRHYTPLVPLELMSLWNAVGWD